MLTDSIRLRGSVQTSTPVSVKLFSWPGQNKPMVMRVRLAVVSLIFTSSKANWETISDDLPQYEAYEPGRNTVK
jgi:hypothetical protein